VLRYTRIESAKVSKISAISLKLSSTLEVPTPETRIFIIGAEKKVLKKRAREKSKNPRVKGDLSSR